MRTYTKLYALAILALATLFAACGDTAEEAKFPCKTGEVLTAVGVCATPGDLVPKERRCATGMLQQSDGTCVPPATPDEPWVFPCEETQVLTDSGACEEPWTFPCAVGNVLQSDGSCTAVGGDELSRIAATSRVYATLASDRQYEMSYPADAYWAEAGGFTFHAVGEDFIVTKVTESLTSMGLVGAWPDWITGYNVNYLDEGSMGRRAHYDGVPNTDEGLATQIFVPKDGSAGITTGFVGNLGSCNDASGFNGWTTSLVLTKTEAYGLTTGKRIRLSETEFDYLYGNRYTLCGTGPDPRVTP